jgi:hypothetical protein
VGWERVGIGVRVMTMTMAQRGALGLLRHSNRDWETTQTLRVKSNTLVALEKAGLAERKIVDGSEYWRAIQLNKGGKNTMAATAQHVDIKLNKYHYRLTSTGGSSYKYGLCEVCRTHVSEVFLQTEVREYQIYASDPPEVRRLHPAAIGYTEYKCHTIFGHMACLESRRRNIKAAA